MVPRSLPRLTPSKFISCSNCDKGLGQQKATLSSLPPIVPSPTLPLNLNFTTVDYSELGPVWDWLFTGLPYLVRAAFILSSIAPCSSLTKVPNLAWHPMPLPEAATNYMGPSTSNKTSCNGKTLHEDDVDSKVCYTKKISLLAVQELISISIVYLSIVE